MKFMIMTFGDRSALADRDSEWMERMIRFMKQIDKDLAAAGELVFEQGLADPSEARTISASGRGVETSLGPVAPLSDSLAGFWVVDVASEGRAVEIAGEIASATEAPVEVRQCADAPPET